MPPRPGRRRWFLAATIVLGVGAAWVLAPYRRHSEQIIAAVRGGYLRPGSLAAALRPAPVFSPPHPATSAAARVLQELSRVEANQRTTRYQHHTQVRERAGDYRWDCSGMATWVLARSARRARRALGGGRIIARGFARQIRRAPTSRSRGGWQQVDHIREVRAGDMFAWERPRNFPSRDSGHVGFLAHAPVELADGVWAARVIDATSEPHGDDTRRSGESGSGRGTMTFAVDEEGRTTAYGWHGPRSLAFVETRVYFGRLH